MARPACELYFNCEHGEKYAIYTNGTLDQKELDFIFPEKINPQYEWVPRYIHYTKVVLHKGSINKRVKAALKIGFIFEDQYQKTKWKNGKSFRLFRERIKLQVEKVEYDPLTLKMFRKEIKLVKQEEYDPLTKKFQEMMLEMNEDEIGSLLFNTYLASGML